MMDAWNRATIVGDPTGGGRDSPADIVGGESVAAYTSDDETVTYVIVGTDDGLVREQEDWMTTETPGAGRGVVVLITDRRVTFVVGECRDPDIDGDYVRHVDHADVDDVTAKNSFLTTAFALTTDGGVRLSLTPTGSDGLEDAAKYVRRASMQWQSAAPFFDDLADELLELEDEAAKGNDAAANTRRQRLESELAELSETSSLHEVDLPALEADRDRAHDQLDDALCRGYWTQARDLTEDGDAKRDADDVTAAVEAYRDASRAYQSMVDFGGPRERSFDAASLDGPLGPFQLETALVDRLSACGEYLERDPAPDAAVAAWPVLLEAYEEFLTAVRIGRDRLDTDLDAFQSTVDAVRQRAADSCKAAASALERRGDEAYEDGNSEQAQELYQGALDALSVRRSLAEDQDDVTAEPVAALREQITEKFERSQWEWVGDQ